MAEIIILSEEKIINIEKTSLTMGVFDGVHAGHRKLISDVCFYAKENSMKSCVLTFKNHPIDILCPEKSPKLLTSLDEKIKLIDSIGPDIIAIIEFTKKYADILPEEFIEKTLIEKLHIGYIAIGGNNRFGKKALGTPEMLLNYPFKTKIYSHEKYNDQIVSSTIIRQAITEGKMNLANKMLSRPYSMVLSKSEKKGIFYADSKKLCPPNGLYDGCINGQKANFSFKNLNQNDLNDKEIIEIFCDSSIPNKNIEISFLNKKDMEVE